MPKLHPESIMLVESVKTGWRIVERSCTRTGLSRDKFTELMGALPTREAAKKELIKMKGRCPC